MEMAPGADGHAGRVWPALSLGNLPAPGVLSGRRGRWGPPGG